MSSGKCLTRIQELSVPKKTTLLYLFQYHGHRIGDAKAENLKHLLQELYPMTPEQTAKYFDNLRAKAKATMVYNRLKRKMVKLEQSRINANKRCLAYKKFEKLLIQFIEQAFIRNIPPLISERLRFISDLILCKLCKMIEIDVPKRMEVAENPCAKFLICISDWVAINLNYLYYRIKERHEGNTTS